MKRIVICCDGTSNKPDAEHVTNVVKVARGVAGLGKDKAPQVVFYDQGVGSDGKLDKLTGGALGRGLAKNIQEAYRFLVINYKPDDEIFLFGFSRGAFTVRSLSGMIKKFGILHPTEIQKIKDTVDRYRDGLPRENPNTYEARIKFLGVWDTVGAMGVQTNRFAGVLGWWIGGGIRKIARRLGWAANGITRDKMRDRFSNAGAKFGSWLKRRGAQPKARYAFLNADMSDIVDNGYHALAIDEKRPIFEATLWEKDRVSIPGGTQTIEQVWFSGVHTEVGGGSPNEQTSAFALDWMAEQAGKHEMEFTAAFKNEVKGLLADNTFEKVTDSPPGMWKAAGSLWREIGASKTGTESVHPSAIRRYCDPHNMYKPPKLDLFMKDNGIDCATVTQATGNPASTEPEAISSESPAE